MNYKKTLALTLVATMVMGSVTYAATWPPKPEEIAATTEKVVYTYEQVLEKALKNTSSLSLNDEQIELLNKQSSYFASMLNGEVYPTDPSAYLNSVSFTALKNLNDMNNSKMALKYKTIMINDQVEYNVKNLIKTISLSEKELEDAKLKSDVLQKKYELVKIKNSLGMVSALEVTSAQADIINYEIEVENMKLNCDKAYGDLARLMGISDRNFVVEYSAAEYEPYTFVGSLVDYLRIVNAGNPMLLMSRVSIDSLVSGKNFSVANSSTPYGYESITYEINNAEASYKDAVNSYTAAGENMYNSILTLEGNIKLLETNLELAKSQLALVETNFANGAATQLDVDSAKLAVVQIESGINASKENYELLVFAFKKPWSASATS